MSKRIFAYVLITALIWSVAAGSLLADGAEENRKDVKQSPFSVNLKVDLPVIVMGTLVATSVLMLEDSLPQGHMSSLKPGRVNVLDRPVINYNYRRWGLVGDIGTVLVPGAMLCMSFVSLPDYGWRGVLEDFLIVGQAIAVSSMMNEIVACAMPRPRPYMYKPNTWYYHARKSSWDWRSFYSGHAGAPFAASTAFSYLFTVRHPHSPWVPAVWTMSLAASTLVAVSRPLAGEHFWTDIIIGAAIGGAWGILIPVLHERSGKIEPGDVRFVFSPSAAAAVAYF